MKITVDTDTFICTRFLEVLRDEFIRSGVTPVGVTWDIEGSYEEVVEQLTKVIKGK